MTTLRMPAVVQQQIAQDAARQGSARLPRWGRAGRFEDNGEVLNNGQGLRPAERALADLRVLRKIALGDINRLEMQILRGDPFASFVRNVLRGSRFARRPSAISPNVEQARVNQSDLMT